MKKIVIVFIMILLFAISGVIQSSFATNLTLPNTPVQIYFSPNGGATKAIIKEIDNAKVREYSLFSSTKQVL